MYYPQSIQFHALWKEYFIRHVEAQGQSNDDALDLKPDQTAGGLSVLFCASFLLAQYSLLVSTRSMFCFLLANSCQ